MRAKEQAEARAEAARRREEAELARQQAEAQAEALRKKKPGKTTAALAGEQRRPGLGSRCYHLCERTAELAGEQRRQPLLVLTLTLALALTLTQAAAGGGGGARHGAGR